MSEQTTERAPKPLSEIVDPGWAEALAPVADDITAMGAFLRAEIAAGRKYLPAGENVLRAFTHPFDRVRVLIVGQDPYPTPGHAVGLSFSVAPDVRPIPRSLANIYREYGEDLGLSQPTNGDLTPWSEQGVLLLNRVLTVQPGEPASHRRKGGRASPNRRFERSSRGGRRSSRFCGAATQPPCARCSATFRPSSLRTRRRCRRRADSSDRNPSAARTRCWWSRVASRVDWRLP